MSTSSHHSRAERDAPLASGTDIAPAATDPRPLHLVEPGRANAEALRASEERFRLLAEAAFEGVGVSEALVWLDVSQQFADMLGYAREDLIGTHVSQVVAPESLERVLHHVDIGYEPVYEVVGLRKDGTRVPVEVRGRTMQVGERRLRVSAVRDISEQKRVREALESQQRRLRALAAALAVAEECERRVVAAQLHDEIGQTLAAAKLKLDGVEQDVAGSACAGSVRDLSRMLSDVIAHARSLITELSPPGIYDLDFEVALEWLATRAAQRDGVECEVICTDGPVAVAPELRVMLFGAARELLRNVARHAGVSRATVRVRRSSGGIELEVEDAGRGFDPGRMTEVPGNGHGALGLFGISERVRAFGGTLSVRSAPNAGTLVRLSLPIAPVSDPDV